MSSDPCETIVEAIAFLQARRNQLQDKLQQWTSEGLDTIALHKQLQSLNEQIDAERALLIQCRKNAALPSHAPLMLIEQTQAIQYFDVPFYQYPVVGQIPPDNNTIPMVSHKRTLLRVYVDASPTTADAHVPAAFTGTLELQTPSGPVTVNPINSPINAGPINGIKRTDLQQTLNFIIPREHCFGVLPYSVSIVDASNATQYATGNYTITFHDVPPLKVHCVLIHYKGLDFSDQPVDKVPDLGTLFESLEMIYRVYPISDLDFDGCETLQWSDQLKFDDNWGALLDTISSMRSASGSNAIYLGFVPAEANCSGICGKGVIGGGACVFRVGGGLEPIHNIAHEMGHAVGRTHAPECLPPGEAGDSNYPWYPTFPRASIGQVGVDLDTLETKDPASFRDYMTYCDSKWTSPYGYMLAYNTIRSGKFSDSAEPLSAVVPREFYSVTLSWDRIKERIRLNSGFHIARAAPDQSLMVFSKVCAHLFTKNDVLITQTFASFGQDRVDSGYVDALQVFFPRVNDLHHMRLTSGEKVLGEFVLAPSAPRVDIPIVRVSPRSGGRWAKVTWKASASEKCEPALRCSLRYSADGKRWRTVIANTRESMWLIDLNTLPGGPECRVQVVASAGLRTAIAESEPFDVALKPRKLFLSAPAAHKSYPVGAPVYCAATAFSPDFGNAQNDDIFWTCLRHGFLGTGQQLIVSHLAIGTHWLQVHVPDGIGNLLTRQVEIVVTG